MPPAFSIVIPLYNKAPEVLRCVSSVLAQTYIDFELIVIDDGSTDTGPDIVESVLDSRLKLIRQRNQGVAAARNHGIEHAVSDFIVFIDADDEWLPTHLESIAALVQRHPEAGLFFTAYWIHRGAGWRRIIRMPHRYLKPGTSLLRDYFSSPNGKLIPTATAMKKAGILAVGGYREMFGEDADLWFRIAAFYPVAYSDRPTAIWHLDAQNRRCAAEEALPELYRPGGLQQSLDQIYHSPDSEPNKERALRYVKARERKAVLETLLEGNLSHANALYTAWSEQFQASDRVVSLLLKSPTAIHRSLGKAIQLLSKGSSMLMYAVDWRTSRKTFC